MAYHCSNSTRKTHPSYGGLEDASPTFVETNIRNWFHKHRYGVKKEQYTDYYFAFTVQVRPERSLTVGQLKKEDQVNFIFISARIYLDDEFKKKVAKLSETKRQQLLSGLRMELIRFRMGYGIRRPLEIWIEARAPIIGLTEWGFIERVRLVDSALILLNEKFRLFFATQN